MSVPISRLLPLLLSIAAIVLLTQCAVAPDPRAERREMEIATEPAGDYWIGRRYWVEHTRFWGYVRRPRHPWSESNLVIVNEKYKLSPDRLPEEPESGPRHGYDHNYEYRLYGDFSGDMVYDPNSNLTLREFVLRDYELINPRPGFLFQPDEYYSPKKIPPLLR